VTVEDLLSAAQKARETPTVDINVGGAFMRFRLAQSHDEILALDRRRQEFVQEVRSKECPKALKPYAKLSDDSLSTAALIAYTADNPKLTIGQALDLMADGLTVQVILKSLQRAGIAHLLEVAAARIDAGKKDSNQTPTTD